MSPVLALAVLGSPAHAQTPPQVPQIQTQHVYATGPAGPNSFERGVRLKPSEELMIMLGLDDEIAAGTPNGWHASVGARLATDLQCGAMRFDVDFTAMADSLKDLPSNLAASGATLLQALPMLTICHTSPSLCAELKNLNLRIEQDLDFRAQVCRSIEGYIDGQVDEHEALRRQQVALEKQQCIAQHGGDAVAVRDCTEAARQPQNMTAIAQGFIDEQVASGPQRLLEAALGATNHALASKPGLYEMLSAVAGEAEITLNGEVYPVLDTDGAFTSVDIVNGMLDLTEYYACSATLRERLLEEFGPDGTGTFLTNPNVPGRLDYLKQMVQVSIGSHLTPADLENFGLINHVDQRHMCFALRDTAALVTAQSVLEETGGIAEWAMDNPELPDIGKTKLKKAVKVATQVVEALASEPHYAAYPEWSAALSALAEDERRIGQALANTLEAGLESQTSLDDDGPCGSYIECKLRQ